MDRKFPPARAPLSLMCSAASPCSPRLCAPIHTHWAPTRCRSPVCRKEPLLTYLDRARSSPAPSATTGSMSRRNTTRPKPACVMVIQDGGGCVAEKGRGACPSCSTTSSTTGDAGHDRHLHQSGRAAGCLAQRRTGSTASTNTMHWATAMCDFSRRDSPGGGQRVQPVERSNDPRDRRIEDWTQSAPSPLRGTGRTPSTAC